MHSDLAKSHTIQSENIAKVVRDAQDVFDKVRVRHEEIVMMARPEEAISKVVAKVVELEQKIARGAPGGGGEVGDGCIKSLFPSKSMVLRQGGGLEKLAGGSGEEYTDSQAQ